MFKEFASLPLCHTSTVLTYSIFTEQTVGPRKAITYYRSSSKDATGCVLAPGQWCASASYKGKPFKQRLPKDAKTRHSGDANYTWHSNTLGGLKKPYTVYPAITDAGLESLVKTYHQSVRKWPNLGQHGQVEKNKELLTYHSALCFSQRHGLKGTPTTQYLISVFHLRIRSLYNFWERK